MKTIILSLFTVLTLNVVVAQEESNFICLSKDEFTDKVYVLGGAEVLFKDGGDMKTEGLVIRLLIEYNKGKLSASDLFVKAGGMRCVDEGSTLDIILENGEKLRLINYNDFDCDAVNYFSLTKYLNLFKLYNITAIKYTNKRDYESIVVKDEMPAEGSSFLKDRLLEIDFINRGARTLKECVEE